MEISIFLAKVIGLYLLIAGLMLLIRRGAVGEVIDELTRSPALVAFAGSISLAIGLLLVVSHNHWSRDWTVVVTLLGWLALLQGVIRLFYPEGVVRWGKTLASSGATGTAGVIVFAIGGFLAYRGFSG